MPSSSPTRSTKAKESHDAHIQHRRARFDYRDVPVHWNGGDAFMTRFFDALSINFPDGERFFIDAVRAFEDRVTDPKLREDIRLFVRQEAQHGSAHDQFNETLRAQGINVDMILRTLAAQKRDAQTRLPPKMQLALTAAAEHITATLAEGFLELSPEFLEHADPTMRALCLWHAVEEVEHKAVAFDVYMQAADGDYKTRALAMFSITLYLHVRVATLMRHMLEADGVSGDRLLIARGLLGLYGPRGHLTRLIPRYLAWFKPNFHPWQTGVPEKVAAWIAEYAQHEDPLRATHAVFPEPARSGAKATRTHTNRAVASH